MNKTLAIIILAIISFASLAYIFMGKSDTTQDIGMIAAKDRVETFLNGGLLPPGSTATIGDVSDENGLYKMPVGLPDGSSIDIYLSKDGQFFFPEGMNIDEITQQIAAQDAANNQTPSMGELKTDILAEGTGDTLVQPGDNLTVDYTGTLEDGTEFDSSIGKTPFTFTIGQGQVIQGWDQGLIGMKVGEERKLVIPGDMAYGPSGSGIIPPNATLIFTVKLISIN